MIKSKAKCPILRVTTSFQGSKRPTRARRKEPLGARAARFTRSASVLHPIVQAKLRLGGSDDKYEREADRIANEVVRMSEPKSAVKSGASPLPENVQAECPACSVKGRLCPACQAKLRRAFDDGEGASDGGYTRSLDGSGQPLTASQRSFFEPRFGADFSAVRVHTGAAAIAVASALNARAFTVGRECRLWRTSVCSG
jgi:uncharacterized protein DUF4157